MPRCSYRLCIAEASVFCSHCQAAFCAAHDEALHIAHPLHPRTTVAAKQAASSVALQKSAEKLRSTVDGIAQKLSAELTVADSERQSAADSLSALKQQLSDQEKNLRAKESVCSKKQEQLTSVQSMLTSLMSGSDTDVIDICANAIAAGTLQLHFIPDGLLRELTSMQREHFKRLLPDVKPVNQQLVQSDGSSFAGCSRCSLLRLCAAQENLRLLYRGSEHGFTPAAFWQHCDGKANTLTVVKVSHLCSLS